MAGFEGIEAWIDGLRHGFQKNFRGAELTAHFRSKPLLKNFSKKSRANFRELRTNIDEY